MSEFKKCPNGHYYQGGKCPYCQSGGQTTKAPTEGGETQKTEIYVGIPDGETNVQNNPSATTVNDAGTVVVNPKKPSSNSNRTVFGTEIEEETPSGGIVIKTTTRTTRKLVGWLVSYSFDKMGVDYKLYEGRNIIGRDMDCNVTVAGDGMMSGKHATLLFRADKYILKDELSTHGTFVNDVDIIEEHYHLQDGDIIRLGQTVFKFRTSL
jgi:hypothetical protein